MVARSLEPYGIYAGNPARLTRYRFDRDKIEFLDGLRWWNFDFARLRDIQESIRKPVVELGMDEIRELF